MLKKNAYLLVGLAILVGVFILGLVGTSVRTQELENPLNSALGDPTDPEDPTPSPTPQTEGSDMYTEINEKALAAQDGREETIGELVDSIFNIHSIGSTNSSVDTALKNRIVRAELGGTRVTEQQLTNTVNWLADQLSAPQYARISSVQTRVLRLDSNVLVPNLFPELGTEENLSATPTTMSACEATCLLFDILLQKAINPKYQKTPSEWEVDFYNFRQSSETQTEEVTTTLEIESNGNQELLQIISGKTQSEIEDLAHRTFDQLGIPR